MSRRRWLLPDTPDVLGELRRQVAVTLDGLDAFETWARGDAAAAERVRDAEQRGDVAKRLLLETLRAAFVLPLEPEDLFTLSTGVDRILNYAEELVSESEVLDSPPDAVIAEMAAQLRAAVGHIDEALAKLDTDDDAATAAADAATGAEQRLERAYYEGMATLLDVQDRSERIARRELYRRALRIGEVVIDVADRVVYAIVKQS